jgi:predicted nucleic acid-binding protein
MVVDIIRHPEQWPTFERHLRSGRLWLSSVVVAELLAGTRDSAEAHWLEGLMSGMRKIPPAGRLLTPDLVDWTRTGHLIARRIRLHGALQPRDHLADVLVLVSAARIGGEVVTANLRHFRAWAALARASGLNVVVSRTLPGTKR